MTIDTTDRQKKYVEAQKKKGYTPDIVFGAAFLRGMRDLGYKSPAWALAEILDNSFQAGAKTASVRFGFDPGNVSQAKPNLIAIVDDGNGMIPEMISYAVRWGGTDREDDRHGFGRFGFGLPSSAVSLSKKYTVYSKIPKQDWHAVTVDIEELAKASGDPKKTDQLLSSKPAKLPAWIMKINEVIDGKEVLNTSKLESGTVIVLEDLDRLRKLPGWITTKFLKEKLLQNFGVIYRHWIPESRIIVDSVPVQPVDPLFLMEHARHFDETPVHAKKVDTRTFEVENEQGEKGTVTIRASFLPPNFQKVDPTKFGRGGKLNKRHDVMKAYNGLQICRNLRQIDCIQPPWTKFQTYDYNIKIEINFDPELDDFFGVTTSKQQIVIDEQMWDKLKNSGKNAGDLYNLIEDMRKQFKEFEKEIDAKSENQATLEEPRKSAVAMEETEKFKTPLVRPTSVQEEESQRQLEREVTKRVGTTGKPQEEVLKELLEETRKRRWEVEFAAVPEGPFYRPQRLGEQKRIIINTDHPFYTKLYALPSAAKDVKAALEVLLFVIAERELDSTGDAEIFYKSERQKWSERLRHALDSLTTNDTVVNIASSMAENMHMTVSSE